MPPATAGDAALVAALTRLDARLRVVVDLEERRAAALTGDGRGSWDGVRRLGEPSVAQLLDDPDAPGIPSLVTGDDPVFGRLAAALAVDAVELSILLIALAPHVEPRYHALYAVLVDDLRQTAVTERLLISILGRSSRARARVRAAVADGGSLVGAGLLRPAGPAEPPSGRPLHLADEVRLGLLGAWPRAVGSLRITTGGEMTSWGDGAGRSTTDGVGRSTTDGAGRPAAPGRGEAAPPAAGHDDPARMVGRGGHAPNLQVVRGDGDVRAAAFELVAGRAWMAVEASPPRPRPGGGPDADGVDPAGRDDLRADLRGAWRLAVVTGRTLVADLTRLAHAEATGAATDLAELVRLYGGQVVLAHRDPLPVVGLHHRRDPASWSDRARAWERAVADVGGDLDAQDARTLASSHRRLEPSAIRAVVDRMLDDVGGDAAALTAAALGAAAAASRATAVRHCERIEPRRTMADLVLTDDSRAGLQRLVYFARHRDRVREQRPGAERLDLTRGPLCLLSGRPGTGKTLAAEVIAGELGVPLFVVDLSRLVSKYVGETESHVDEALAEAQRAEAVLLFDEADTVFSRRIEHASTGGEHFANMLAGYLLQRVERHDGVVLLASNLQYAIDEAFLRRFDFHVEFPLPLRDQRRAIWSLLVGARVDDAVCDRLASHRLSGGEIRNATVKAVFLAEQDATALCADHLDEGVRLQALESGQVSRAVDAAPDGGAVLRGLVEQLDEVLRDHLAACFRKEVHVVHGAPTEERLSGQRPAVNVALFRLARSRGRLRAGLMVSAWANRAEEEYEVLGAVQELLAAPRDLVVHGRTATQRLHESHDFDLIHRYWSSHDRPVRPCLVIDVEVIEADVDGRPRDP